MTNPNPIGQTLIVVFGAAVRPDGSASPTLARRIGYAAAAAQASPGAHLFLSGGIGDYPPSEAAVMVRLLSGAVHPDRLILDERSIDTLQTVVAAADFARAHGYSSILTCTDAFHQLRVCQ